MSLSSKTRNLLGIALTDPTSAKEVADAVDAATSGTIEAGDAIANLTVTFTTNGPTPNGSVTIANGTTPTVAELGEAVAELGAKVNAILAALRTTGIIET